MHESNKNTHHLSGKTIIIAGAGIAGLSFAIALEKLWDQSLYGPPPTVRIFERDSEENAINRQGYSLSLRSDSPSEGIQTLKKLGIIDEMIEASITGLEHKGSFGIWDKKMDAVMKMTAKMPKELPVGAMRIARGKMRRVLVEKVEGFRGKIEWGRWCVSIENSADGGVRVELNDGEFVHGDLLIAADGASSKLRGKVRPKDQLHYAGIVGITATSRWESAPPAPVDQDWGIVLAGTGTCMFVSPVDDKSALWSLSWREEKPREAKKSFQDPKEIEALLAEAKERCTCMPPLLTEMLEHTDTSTLWLLNALDKSPFAHSQLPSQKVIFIGDANHAVSPFAGAGANIALMDGWDLASSLCNAPSLEQAVEKYDKLAVPRAKKILDMSHFVIKVGHSKGWMSWIYMLMLKLAYWVFLKKYVDMK